MARSVAFALPSLVLVIGCAASTQDDKVVLPTTPSVTNSAPREPGADFECEGGRCPAIQPKLALGEGHACAVADTGKVYCWGRNSWGTSGGGQLGDGTREHRSLPTEVADLPRAFDVAASAAGTCAIVEDGAVWCWGVVATKTFKKPTRIEGIDKARSLTVGPRHACVIGAQGKAWCWGDNAYGQLGNGSTTSSDRAVEVRDLEGARAIVAGDAQTCAIHPKGTACWGAKRDAPSPPGSAPPKPSTVPVPQSVDGLPALASLASAGGRTCGVASSGTVHCWGTGPNPAPAKLDGYADVVGFAMAVTHRCATTKNRTVVCDGFGAALGGSGPKKPAPIEAFGDPSEHAQIALSGSNTCLLDRGEVRCVGDNLHGQLGIGETGTFTQARPVAGIDGATSVVVTQHAGCALDAKRRVLCWGEGLSHFAKLPDHERRTDSHVPQEVAGIDGAERLLHGSSVHEVCAANAKGELTCFRGGNYAYPTDNTSASGSSYLPYRLAGLSKVSWVTPRLSGGAYAILTNGDVVAYRPGPLRADKAGRRVADAEVEPIKGLGSVVRIAIGERQDQACALRKNGSVGCFALSSSPGKSAEPAAVAPDVVEVTGLGDAVELASGGFDSLADQQGKAFFYARKKDGSVVGFAVSGQRGVRPTVSEPKSEPAFSGATALSRHHMFCAGTSTGLLCDRDNVWDKDPSRTSPLAAFSKFSGPITAIDGYMYNTCAIGADGKVVCLGSNRGRAVGSTDRQETSEPVLAKLPRPSKV